MSIGMGFPSLKQVHGLMRASLIDKSYFPSRLHQPKVITKHREDRNRTGQVFQCHKAL